MTVVIGIGRGDGSQFLEIEGGFGGVPEVVSVVEGYGENRVSITLTNPRGLLRVLEDHYERADTGC